MAGRPKRVYEVKAYLLRLPPALIERMDICCSMLDVATRQRLPRNSRLQTALEEWCARVEGLQTLPSLAVATTLPDASTVPPERSPAPDPQPASEPSQRPSTPARTRAQKREEMEEQLQRILTAREEYDRLSLEEFGQLLFDRHIYRATDRKTGEEKPVNSGTLSRWLRDKAE